MQEEKLRLRGLRVGALPILNHFIERMGLEQELTLALKNPGYADVLLALLKNIVVDRNALYAVGEWVALYDVGLVALGKIGDDKLGRALDRLFGAGQWKSMPIKELHQSLQVGLDLDLLHDLAGCAAIHTLDSS